MGMKYDACHGKTYWPRISFSMSARLFGRYYGREAYFQILDELDSLERKVEHTNTKPESQFKHLPLYPFFHKHFFSAQHLPRNIGDRWGISNGHGGNRDLMDMINQAGQLYGESPDEWPKRLVHDFAMGAFRERAGRLTGDWIIYAKHNGENYYLAVVDHSVQGRSNDQQLFDWLRISCEWEYPFLFQDASARQSSR